MHILYIADSDTRYGAFHSLFQLVSEMKKIEDTIQISVVVDRHSDRTSDFRQIGCLVYRIGYEPFIQAMPYRHWKFPIKFLLHGARYIQGRIFALRELEQQMDLKSIDIIHSNSSREDLGAALSAKYGIPLVWHIREFGDLDFGCFSYRKNYISFMNQSAAEFIAISEAVKEHWIHKGISKEKIIRIYNGVDKNPRIKHKYPQKGDVIHFIMLGSLHETKGHEQLIKAIALLPGQGKERVRLDIAGDGSEAYKRKLLHLISVNHLEKNIRLLGYRKDFYQKLSRYDCGMVCSKSEGFGRVSAEYMMAGLPVIASDTGANPELVKNYDNGLLYRYNDVADLAAKMNCLLNHESKIEEMGRHAYRCALQKYTASANAFHIYQEYKKIIEEQS